MKLTSNSGYLLCFLIYIEGEFMINEFMNYAVGQGGFYAGRIGDSFNFIYDCGTTRPKYCLNKSIDSYINKFNRTKTIDLLILSHFDRDHISGVLDLQRNYQIKCLVIPYLGPKSLLFWEFIFHFYTINVAEIKEIILIKNDNDNDYDYDNDYHNEVSVSSEFKIKVKQQKNYTPSNVAWNFEFFNTSYLSVMKKKIKDFEKNLSIALNNSGQSNLTGNISAIDIFKILGLNKIIKIYDLSFKRNNRNNISLCLYHSPYKKYVQEVQIAHGLFYNTRVNCLNKIKTNATVGTLLTGDFSLDDSNKASCARYCEFLGWFNSIYDSNSDVLFMDLPHHGSKYNWNNNFLKILNKDKTYLFGNASISNRYHHPSPQVIETIRNQEIIYLQCDDNNFLSYTLKL